MRAVYVTGLGVVSCLGNDAAGVADRLRRLEHGMAVMPAWVEAGHPVSVAAPLPGFRTDAPDPEDWEHPGRVPLRREQLRSLAPHGLYAHDACAQALAQAGWDAGLVQAPETGLYTASSGSSTLLHRHLDRLHQAGPQRASPNGVVASIAGTLTFNLGAYYGIRGESLGFVSACASSGHALGAAFEAIRHGRQERVLVVGGEDFHSDTLLPFATLRALSPNPDPDTASRPFDARRDGFVGTGGSAALTLESADSLQARGVRPLAHILGWGQASDGHHVAIAHPDGDGLARAMQNALSAADLSPEAIDYVNAHATSTVAGDRSEIRALQRVFTQAGARPWISSTKALTGHGLSLSSILEALFCVLAIDEGFLPGTAHLEQPDPEARGLRLLTETIEARPGVVMSNSSGFGGANVALILARPHDA